MTPRVYFLRIWLIFVVVRPSVCRLSFVVCLSVCLSVTFVHPILRRLKFSAMFLRHRVPWPSIDIQVQFYGDHPRETPPSGELNRRGVAKYSDFVPINGYISETVIGGFNQRHGEALPPQIFLTLKFVVWAKLQNDYVLLQRWNDHENNKITFKRTWSLSNAVCFKYVKYLTTNHHHHHQYCKSRSRDPFPTPFDLIFHYYR